MSEKKRLLSALTRKDSIRFKTNEKERSAINEQFDKLKKIKQGDAFFWSLNDKPSIANTRIKEYPTGHLVFYNSEGRRFLFTDPEGHPLHECEWKKDEKSGGTSLAFVRMQIDSGLWYGIQPKVKTFSIKIDLKNQPNWATMTLDDVRSHAAKAWDVPLAEIKHFYKDENFVSTVEAKYDVHLIKDGIYALMDGTFEDKIFISYMLSVNWEKLDIIPVVELYQSTLPGCGAAAFEVLWGLYDDQSRETDIPPLRFRGLPTFPSQQAFNVFSAYLIPKEPEGEDMMDVFMDFHRSHEITWTPRPDPPWRYFSSEHSICLTVQNDFLYKVTALNDPVAIPYINEAISSLQQQSQKGKKKGRYEEEGWRPYASCQRHLHVGENSIMLMDDNASREIPLLKLWRITSNKKPLKPQTSYPFNWRYFFRGSPPEVDPVNALLTVPLYPEGAAEIEETSLQPMAIDQILYYMEMTDDMDKRLKKINSVLIHTFDTTISGCIDCKQEREYTVLYGSPEWAQKNAQLLWDHAVSKKQLNALKKVSFLPEQKNIEAAYLKKYDMIYKWIPFIFHLDRHACADMLKSVTNALNPNGLLFLVGPRQILGFFDHYSLKCLQNDSIVKMPFFKQHLRLYPETLINPEVNVFFAEKKENSTA